MTEIETLRARIAELEKQRDGLAKAVSCWLGIAENCSIESGCCCCGDDMKNHASPMICGHSPVDMANSSVDFAIKESIAALASVQEGGAK